MQGNDIFCPPTNFQSSKYQKRFFQLTSDDLVYAKDIKDLKEGGNKLECFAIHELKWVKKKDATGLEVCFSTASY